MQNYRQEAVEETMWMMCIINFGLQHCPLWKKSCDWNGNELYLTDLSNELKKRQRSISQRKIAFMIFDIHTKLDRLTQKHQINLSSSATSAKLSQKMAHFCARDDNLSRHKNQKHHFGLNHSVNQTRKKFGLVVRIMPVSIVKTFQSG